MPRRLLPLLALALLLAGAVHARNLDDVRSTETARLLALEDAERDFERGEAVYHSYPGDCAQAWSIERGISWETGLPHRDRPSFWASMRREDFEVPRDYYNTYNARVKELIAERGLPANSRRPVLDRLWNEKLRDAFRKHPRKHFTPAIGGVTESPDGKWQVLDGENLGNGFSRFQVRRVLPGAPWRGLNIERNREVRFLWGHHVWPEAPHPFLLCVSEGTIGTPGTPTHERWAEYRAYDLETGGLMEYFFEKTLVMEEVPLS